MENVDLGLNGRVALVTGGTRGIGRAIAEALVAEGARVAITGRDGARTVEAAAEIGAVGVPFDSADLASILGLIAATEAELGSIDVYVANTGGPRRDADPLAFAPEEWEAAHRTLVISPMAIITLLLPGMRERGFGRVIAVSSSSAVEPLSGLQLSNANRPGLLAGFKLLAREAAADGVTFNAVLPGRIATDRLRSGYESPEALAAAAERDIPARRTGTPEEVAAAAVFLASARASYVTGQSLLVDGGLTRSW
ncbi:MAG: SDR family oxidoreductase [Patulibacter minatonensis]